MSWNDVRGHDAIVQQFDYARRRGRLAHAYLFAGPRGVGKRTFARELAKALLCERDADRLEACDVCPSCRQVDASTHPDLTFSARPEESLDMPIEVVRELCGHLALKPARGTRRVAVLDDADDLNEASANCFLKTLEEPPPGCVLILIGVTPERQLGTIRSRCQLIRFAPLPESDLREVLRHRGIDDSTRVDRLIRLAGGSVGQALALDDDSLWGFRSAMLDELTAPEFDAVEMSGKWMRFVEEAGKESAAQRGRAGVVLRMLVGMLESALRLSIGADAPGLSSAEDAKLAELANRLGTERLLECLERSFVADMHIDRRVQLVLAVEAFADALARSIAMRN